MVYRRIELRTTTLSEWLQSTRWTVYRKCVGPAFDGHGNGLTTFHFHGPRSFERNQVMTSRLDRSIDLRAVNLRHTYTVATEGFEPPTLRSSGGSSTGLSYIAMVLLAEGEGVEPTRHLCSLVFKTSAVAISRLVLPMRVGRAFRPQHRP